MSELVLTSTTQILKPNYENIPSEMKFLNRWVCWKALERKGKITKVPFQPNGSAAAANDENTWYSFKSVVSAYETGKFDGIGFMLGDGIIGIDLDDCLDEFNKLSTIAKDILGTIDSYYEVSVSGGGAHIFVKGEIPKNADFMKKNTELEIEIYESGRFFTITGKAKDVKSLNDDQNGLEAILNKYFKKPEKVVRYSPQNRFINMSNSELWNKMFSSKNGHSIKSLYDGQLINGDHSSSDIALSNHLAFWTNKDFARMDSMFRESGLMREKWDRKTGNSTYGRMTIQKAINDTFSVLADYQDNFEEKVDKDPLEYNKNGNLIPNSRNAELILKSSPFKEVLAFDSFKNTEAVKGNLPWRKRERPYSKYEPWLASDDKRLLHYFGKKHDFKSANIIQNAYVEVTRQQSFHPVKEYLESFKWDGVKRVDSFFIDYLGAEDSPYIRSVTRKWFTAAVNRIYEPGCKFDYMPVLVGPQGAGKSSTIAKLAGEWFSDSLRNFDSKEAGEHLQNSWIFEFGELAAMKKGEVEEIKAFITKRVDSYRVAYDRIVSEFPRKCVFIGTTNTQDFLMDPTGNRRFWAITVNPDKRIYNPITDLTNEIIGQLWAEAMEFYKNGEKLYLDSIIEEQARQIQEGHTEEDPRTGIIQKYLNTRLPFEWDSLEIAERRSYLKNSTGNIQREKVCAAEIWTECLDADYKKITVWDSRQICDILRKLGWVERNPKRTRFKIYGTQTTFIKCDSKV